MKGSTWQRLSFFAKPAVKDFFIGNDSPAVLQLAPEGRFYLNKTRIFVLTSDEPSKGRQSWAIKKSIRFPF